MKKLLSVYIFTILLTGTVLAQSSAMTYNLRFNNPDDGVNWWENRKAWVANLIRFYEPGVMGTQEGKVEQVMYLDSALTNYSYVGVGRDDGDAAGEYTAIFYRDDLYEVLASGTFWLSETPDVPSFGWGANFRRISTWAKLKDRFTGAEFFVFNAHLDHEVPEARINAVKLIHQKVTEINKEQIPVLVMGDLNATPDSPPIGFLTSVMNDAKTISKYPPFGPEGTFNGFDTSHPLDYRIDYIFADDQISVQKYGVIADTRNQRTPSDHLPVIIYYNFK